jgi:large subunit ribosomal protein L17e
MVKYSREPAVADKAAKAMGKELRTSFKNTYNVAQAIKGMGLTEAKSYLDAALDKKRIIPFRKFASGVGRKAQCKEFKCTQGRWPTKSIKAVLGLLKNGQANAEFKNLDTDNLVVKHIQVNRAQPGRRRTYRAHGRINAYMSSPCHVEIILEEEAEEVAKADSKPVKFTQKQLAKNRLTAAN